MNVISTENLTKRYGQRTGLAGLNLNVPAGIVFGFLGPNGAGKTTTIRLMLALLRPTSGLAEVAGYNVATHPAKVRARIGFMSGNTGIYDRMTAWEMVEYFGRLYGVPEIELQERIEKPQSV